MRTSEVLNKAADVIQRDGWGQGSYCDFEDAQEGESSTGHPVCAMGAIYEAAGRPVVWDAHRHSWNRPGGFNEPAGDALGAHVGDIVPDWNDCPGRTASEVLEAFRAAAVIEAAREEQDAAYATYEQNVVSA